ncbi:hypothetical protein KQI52_06455 [bacterium]|nr:hypothetical protein [bacterium]
MQTNFHRLTLRILTAGLLLTALFMVVGCSTESDDIPTGPAVTVDLMIERGWEYLNNGEVDNALNMFADAANAESSNLEAYLGLGYAFADSREPISAQRNLSNVLTLGAVLIETGEVEATDVDALFAEACAGKASVALSTQDFEMAVEEAQAAQEYWADMANPTHRWLPGFDMDSVKLLEAMAWYGQGEYGEVMVVLDDVDDNAFIPALENAGVIVEVPDEAVDVTLLQNTHLDGIAQLDLPIVNLVYPVSVMQDDITFEITGYDVTGDAVRFKGNPIPAEGDSYVVTYYYAVNYGEFLITLQEKLNELQ